jgi:hypothetical protein
MALSATLLCGLLANRLNAVVPNGFSVTAADGFVLVKLANKPFGSGSGVKSILEQRAGDPIANITLAAQNALNSVQDFISEETHWPWPPTVGRSRSYMAMPWATIRDGNLFVGYGETDELTVAVEPIPLHALDDGAPST